MSSVQATPSSTSSRGVSKLIEYIDSELDVERWVDIYTKEWLNGGSFNFNNAMINIKNEAKILLGSTIKVSDGEDGGEHDDDSNYMYETTESQKKEILESFDRTFKDHSKNSENLGTSNVKKKNDQLEKIYDFYENKYLQYNSNARGPKNNKNKGSLEDNLNIFFKDIVNKVLFELTIKGEQIQPILNNIPIKKGKTVPLSAEGKIFANSLLSTIANGILTLTPYNVNEVKQRDELDFKNLYDQEDMLLHKLAEDGSLPGQFDKRLLNAFNRCTSTRGIIPLSSGYPDNVKKQIISGKQQKTYIINNAVNKTVMKKLEIDEDNNVEIFCPVSSVIDAMGSFGSCGFNKELSRRTNFVDSDMEISIKNKGNTSQALKPDDFEMNFKVYKKKDDNKSSIKNKSNVFGINYGVSHGIPVGYRNQNFSMYNELTIVISEKAVNELSAKTTYKSILDTLINTFKEDKSHKAVWDSYLNLNRLAELTSMVSRKLIGDFFQELNAICTDGGFKGLNPPPQYKSSNILLANGDQPSGVRSGFMLVHPGTTGMNRANASVAMLLPSEGHLYKYNNNTKGGTRKYKRRTYKKKNKGRKSRKQKRKTIKYKR